MLTIADTSTVDLTRTRIRMCDDVTFSPQVYGDEAFYHIELPSRSQFFRIGYIEYVFLSLLDGRTTFSEALAITARTQGATAFSQQQALSLYEWALTTELATFADAAARPKENAPSKKGAAEIIQKVNPFWIRIPFGRPDAVLQAIRPFAGWLFSPLATFVGMLFMLAAAVRLTWQWDEFSHSAGSVFGPDNWLWLLCAWVLLKVLHETAHGLVCQRYGGSVRETGIILAFFAPLAYVDVSSCWRFPSRWQRIHVAAAGMYMELLLASIAVFTWSTVDSNVASHLLYNIIVMASVSTLLFNANPLMRFDGYYILSDLLEIPNLYTRASESVQHLLQRILTGERTTSPVIGGKHIAILRAYGIAATFWRLLICTTMLIAASVMFEGAGVLLAVVGIIAWFGLPIWKACGQIHRLFQASPLRLVRGSLIVATFCAMLSGVLFGLPVPFSTTAPGVVNLPEGFRVHAEADGFIEHIHVEGGQQVQKDELLLTLRNEEITNRLSDLVLQIRQETIRQQIAMKDHDAGLASVAKSNLKSLNQRLREARKQNDGLLIYAPVAGAVVASNLAARLQTYVHEGEDLLFVDDGRSRELRISVSQDHLALAERHLEKRVRIRIGTRPIMDGVLDRVIPRASRTLTQNSLAATEGGTLAVMAVDEKSGDIQLTEQRFEAVATLNADALGLPVGERAYVQLGTQHTSLAEHLYEHSSKWLITQIDSAKQSMDD